MKKLTAKNQKAKDIAAIEAALAETRADIAAGRVVKESAETHVRRMNKLTLNNDNTRMLTQRDFAGICLEHGKTAQT